MSVFANDFHHFARGFIFNHITDTSGGIVSIQNPPEKKLVSWNTNEDETEGIMLETVPFTITEFTTELQPGQNIRLSLSARGNQRVSWRLKTDHQWSVLPSSDEEAPIGNARTNYQRHPSQRLWWVWL